MQPVIHAITPKKKTLAEKIRGFFSPQQLVLLMMVLPAMTALIVFSYIPMSGIVISVKEYTLGKGFFDGKWVGAKYFLKAFNDETFWMTTRNTLTISLLHMVFCFPAPVFLALMYNESSMRRLKRFSQTCSYIPHFLSFVVVAAFWQLLLDSDGLVNDVLMRLGLIHEPIGFWTTPEYYYVLEVIISLWKGIGWDAIIYFAAITAVDQEVYEAALVDGAGRFRRVFSIREQQQARYKMWEYLRGLGVDVTSEGAYRELDDRLDCLDCPYVEKEGHRPEELIPGRWRETPLLNLGSIPYVWWLENMTDEEWVKYPANVFTGYPCEKSHRKVFYGPMHGEDIWLDQFKRTPLPPNPIAWTAKYIHEFFTCQVPYLYLSHFQRVALDIDNTAEDKSDRLILRLANGVVCRGKNTSIEKNGVLLKWKDDLLLPLGNKKDCFVAYSANGKQGAWNIPDADFPEATLHEITISGNQPMGKAVIDHSVIQLSLRPGQAVLIAKA